MTCAHGLFLIFSVLIAFGRSAPADDLCAARLWSKYRSLPSIASLKNSSDRAGADEQMNVRDTLLMELSFIKPGSVDPTLIGLTPFATLVDAHENLRRLTNQLAGVPVAIQPPTWRQRLHGRTQFTRASDLVLETREALYLVWSYWTNMNARLQGTLEAGSMWTQLRTIDNDLAERADVLLSAATRVERRQPQTERLRALLKDWRQHANGRLAAKYLMPYLKNELVERMAENPGEVLNPTPSTMDAQRAYARALEVQARRAALRTVKDPEPTTSPP